MNQSTKNPQKTSFFCAHQKVEESQQKWSAVYNFSTPQYFFICLKNKKRHRMRDGEDKN